MLDILENENANCEYNYLLPLNTFLKLTRTQTETKEVNSPENEPRKEWTEGLIKTEQTPSVTQVPVIQCVMLDIHSYWVIKQDSCRQAGLLLPWPVVL